MDNFRKNIKSTSGYSISPSHHARGSFGLDPIISARMWLIKSFGPMASNRTYRSPENYLLLLLYCKRLYLYQLTVVHTALLQKVFLLFIFSHFSGSNQFRLSGSLSWWNLFVRYVMRVLHTHAHARHSHTYIHTYALIHINIILM